MNQLLRTLSVVLGAAVLWIPYYVWGVGSSNRMLDGGKYLLGILLFTVTAIFGFAAKYFNQYIAFGRKFPFVVNSEHPIDCCLVHCGRFKLELESDLGRIFCCYWCCRRCVCN